ncbi:hypothetical protein [Methanocella arvoryzae]|nr:hypothetical protein [Methanocella arvoryzae]
MLLIAGDIVNFLVNFLSSNPFCCVVVFAPGLIVPIYRWIKDRLKR